ncbi:MAG: YigZ family protein [Clostridia bacterium]|nr:YigZ family protein [Clostridia bacterium]
MAELEEAKEVVDSKNSDYKSVDALSMVQMTVDKSRFIAVIQHVESVNDVKTLLGSLKKSNKDAKHIAYAYRLGADYSVAKHNDDGEPAGSAGLPIFAAIENSKLSNTAIAVVRYFGGKELGKSKLTRTYAAVANSAVKYAKIFIMKFCNIYDMKVSYADFAQLGKLLTEKGYSILDQNINDTMPLIKVAIPTDIADKEIEEIRARIRGANFITNIGSGYYRFKSYSK